MHLLSRRKFTPNPEVNKAILKLTIGDRLEVRDHYVNPDLAHDWIENCARFDSTLIDLIDGKKIIAPEKLINFLKEYEKHLFQGQFYLKMKKLPQEQLRTYKFKVWIYAISKGYTAACTQPYLQEKLHDQIQASAVNTFINGKKLARLIRFYPPITWATGTFSFPLLNLLGMYYTFYTAYHSLAYIRNLTKHLNFDKIIAQRKSIEEWARNLQNKTTPPPNDTGKLACFAPARIPTIHIPPAVPQS